MSTLGTALLMTAELWSLRCAIPPLSTHKPSASGNHQYVCVYHLGFLVIIFDTIF